MPVINTHQNIAAFLDMLAVSEGTANHPLTKNRGYEVIVTGLDGKPEIFTDYSDHPFAHGRPAKVFNRRGEKSTASGRYQQLYLFWPHYRKQLALPDFSPLSQDRLAIQLIRERGALDDIRAGRIERAISRCRNIWASLPGAGYGQREHSLEKLVTVWRTAGGVPA
ncbi:glycoside hydrolase family 104 protein [Escherichia coli]|nr:glycoside hydrolase family 104 protein [Escherichia coli]